MAPTDNIYPTKELPLIKGNKLFLFKFRQWSGVRLVKQFFRFQELLWGHQKEHLLHQRGPSDF